MNTMNNTITVRERVLNEIRKQLVIPSERSIVDSHKLKDDLGADSLDLVELSMNLEDEFAIEIADEDFWSLKTVSDVLAYMERRVAAQPA